MTNKLFVASLPFEFTDQQLLDLFSPLGAVSGAKMVMDRKHGRTRGFGFVTMASDEEAAAAIEKLNGSNLGDRKIWVTLARPEKEKAPRDGGPGVGAGPQGGPRFDRGRGRRESGGRGRGQNGGNFNRPRPEFPADEDAQPRNFDALFGPPPVEGAAPERRPFGRSGRGIDAYGNPRYFGQGSNGGGSGGSPRSGPRPGQRPWSGPRRGGSGGGQGGGGGWRPSSDRPQSGRFSSGPRTEGGRGGGRPEAGGRFSSGPRAEGGSGGGRPEGGGRSSSNSRGGGGGFGGGGRRPSSGGGNFSGRPSFGGGRPEGRRGGSRPSGGGGHRRPSNPNR